MRKIIFALGCILACARLAAGTPIVLYSNLAVTDSMAAASRPNTLGNVEIEAADDFILTGGGAAVTELKFIGILTGGINTLDVNSMNLEIYRVFPKDSQDPPDGKVPTRVNSPSDVAFAEAAFTTDFLSLTVTALNGSFSALNSVKNGINPSPLQTTGGEGAVRGVEFLFDAVLKSPLILPADHYFFVPQVGVNNPADSFYWLSASRPIVAPGTPFAPDLQAWIRNGNLDPDWLRIGMDIVGGNPAPTFNMAFEVDGEALAAVPEPGALLLVGTGLGMVVRRVRRKTT
jgi:hypothetical protein